MKKMISLIALLLVQTACSNGSDPFEPVNRGVYWFNDKTDTYLLAPVAKGYRAGVPKVFRNRIGDGLSHLREPITFANSVLQLDHDKAADTFWRFVINSTLGVGGFVDVAKEFGLEKHDEDFGQTLARYGVPSGPYLMLPLLGPSNVRDFAGNTVDGLAYMPNYAHDIARYGVRGVNAVHTREQLLELVEQMKEESFDPYSAVKSAHFQHRAKKIKE